MTPPDFAEDFRRTMLRIIFNHAPISAFDLGLRQVLTLPTADNDNAVGGDAA
jgi:hypothetical protein